MTNHDKNTANIQSLPYCSPIVRLLFVYCSFRSPPFLRLTKGVSEEQKASAGKVIVPQHQALTRA